TVLGQKFEEPIVKAADFYDGHVAAVGLGEVADFVEERADFLPFGADLPAEDDVPRFLSHVDGQLLAVLVDADVQHDWLSWFHDGHQLAILTRDTPYNDHHPRRT